MKKIICAFLILSALVFAATPQEGSWVFSTNKFGPGPNDIEVSLNSDDELRLTIDSSATGKAFFKLVTVFDTPTTDSYQLEFDARVNAQGADLDYAQSFGAGEQLDNDAPNLFVFAYNYENATMEDLPIGLTSISFYDKKDSLCHVHFECNWMGDPESYYGFYCSSENIASGWVYDAKKFGMNVKENEISGEAFQDTDWKTIRLYMDAGECSTNRTTLMIMGADTLASTPYTWEIKNVRLVTSTTTSVPLNYVYNYVDGDYVRVAKPQACGDGEKEGSEECDGTDGIEEGWTCTSGCKLEPLCGDNKKVGDELCDGILHTPGFTCASNCSAELPVCGDNLLVENEVCDGTKTPSGFECSADCLTMSPVCGDDLVIGNEECDGVNGTDTEHGCTNECTLYRLLSEPEQEGIGVLMQLVESAELGVPSTSKVVIPPGVYTAKDFADQFLIQGSSVNGNVSFCVTGVTECEARYVFIDDAFATNTSLAPLETLQGIAKVYKVQANGTTGYYIGFKGGSGWLPYLEMNTTIWIIVGVLVFLLLGAVVLLVLILGGYMYTTKKGGVEFKKLFK